MKHWKKKAGAFLLCLALLFSNQNLLFTFATEYEGEKIEVEQEADSGTAAEGNAEAADKTEDAGDEDNVDAEDPEKEDDAEKADGVGVEGDADQEEGAVNADDADVEGDAGKGDDTDKTGDVGAEGDTDKADDTDVEGDVDSAELEGDANKSDNADVANDANKADIANDADKADIANDADKADDADKEEASGAIITDPTQAVTVNAENLPDGITVTADVPANAFEEPVTLNVEIIDTESDEGSEAMTKVAAVLAQKQQVIAGAYIVDISFVNKNGKEMEPDKAKSVTVMLQTEAVDIGVSSDANVGNNTAVYHVADGDAVKLDSGKVKLDGDNKFIGMSFQADSFSPFAAVILDSPVTKDTADGETVCKIGDIGYPTLDDAVAAAEDGATIHVLADCETSGLNLTKSLTIAGTSDGKRPEITFTNGIGLWGVALKFRNCEVIMNGIGSTPYVEWSWMTICASTNASLELDNATMTMDGANAGDAHAIYFCSNNKLNLKNNSTLTIMNYQQDALEWDGGDGGYNVNITDSRYISDANRSGFTGTFYATIDNSTVEVLNSTGNGSNGTYYTIKNNSTVLFENNGAWGISAWRIDMTDNSVLTACNNGYSGIWTRVLNANSTCTIDVEKNGSNARTFKENAGIFFQGNGTYKSVIEEGAKVTIKDNAGSGIYTGQTLCNMTIYSATITNNGTGAVNEQKVGAENGGGVYNVGTMVLGTDVVLYNNHADEAGDDIYNTGKISFHAVGTDWELDGEPDCTDAIDGWYYDGYATDDNDVVISTRWNAHSGNPYAVEYTGYGNEFSGTLALKAAHGYDVEIPEVPELPESEWDISKSKTATNLDESYMSKVTLSLPSNEEKLVSDVVFVLDKSTSPALEEKALNMLTALKQQIENTNAEVKVGVVIFNQKANATDFLNLATQYDEIENAIKQNISSGTNTHAGLLAGKTMLDSDTTVAAERKYLIFVSDGITYMYNADPTVTAWNFRADAVVNWAGPDNWNSKYGNNEAPGSWIDYLQTVSKEVAAQGTMYEYPYGGTVVNSTPVNNQSDYANSIDKALYLTYLTYQSAMKAGYHCYAVQADTGKGGQYQWGPGFMNFLADGETVSFESIQNEILYLVDAGSKVEDYIGYVSDDYDFDFVNDADAMSLKVGNDVYSAEKTGENQYGFKKLDEDTYAYTVTYIRGNGKDEEHFVWNINVPVKNFEPVQLTYTVKLTNPSSVAGTYGEYDENGSMNYEGLYTNNSATLYPKDSNGKDGKPQIFAKPTVSYTVTENQPPKEDEDKPENPGSDPEPGTPSDPESETPSDPAPVTVVKQPTITTPAAPAAPEAPAPVTGETAAGAATGDDSPVAVWLVIAMAAIAAVAGLAVSKRRNSGRKNG